ncbi:hypothetical protein F5B21DRAFT_500527 [Xylaria acuta]|nr:hypothetical protein F5B21DRAFT_500527 [Xylaria acuta]
MAPTKFLFYPRLPPELKIMIWEYVFEEWSSGAHRFRLTIAPEYPTKLVMRPDKDQKDDASAWRERLALAKTDGWSEDVFNTLQRKAKERNQLKLLHKDTSYSRRRRVEENGVAANIYPETDLVTFRFNYGATQASLAILRSVENQEVFAGITQVGIEVDFLQKGYKSTKKYKPFWFMCNHGAHNSPGTCLDGVVKFLRWFKDLKVVYLIFTLRAGDGHIIVDLLPNCTTVLPRLRADRRRTNQATLDAFRGLQDIAQQTGLRQFHDRNGTYCEIAPVNPFSDLLYLDHFQFLESRWSHINRKSAQADWQSVQFKPLIWTDLRDATVAGDERPLRRVGPW